MAGKELKRFKDDLHGLEAYAISKTTAWELIKGDCRVRNWPVPTMDQVREIKKEKIPKRPFGKWSKKNN